MNLEMERIVKVLPVKFESILRTDRLKYMPLILPVNDDLRSFRHLVRFAKGQEAGTLAILYGRPGTGKTTACYAATSILHDEFAPVLSVPPRIALPLREIPQWLSENLPDRGEKTTLVLIDGRESTDDDQGLKDVMSTLNNLVRGRPDLLFAWPTTDSAWRDRLLSTARSFGSTSFCPENGVIHIEGPSRSQWIEAASLVIDQLGSNWDEFGINESTAEALAADTKIETLGDFFTEINRIRTEQDAFAEDVTGLPKVVFVVSSHSEIMGHIKSLRNSNTYKLRTDEIIRSASKSEPGKFWTERGAIQKSNLAWVSALLQARLVALTPSTVAHACAVETPQASPIRKAISRTNFTGSRSSGGTAYKRTDLARFLSGQPVPELTAAQKGRNATDTLAAYDEVQRLSSMRHLEINRAILSLAAHSSPEIDPTGIEYEKVLNDNAQVDAIVPVSGERLFFEFHHLSAKNCNPNSISRYIMGKLRVYATTYNLIQR